MPIFVPARLIGQAGQLFRSLSFVSACRLVQTNEKFALSSHFLATRFSAAQTRAINASCVRKSRLCCEGGWIYVR